MSINSHRLFLYYILLWSAIIRKCMKPGDYLAGGTLFTVQIRLKRLFFRELAIYENHTKLSNMDELDLSKYTNDASTAMIKWLYTG